MVRRKRCFYCDRILTRKNQSKDHLTPKSRRGSDKRWNLVDACRPCNNLKGCLTLEEFRVVMAFRAGWMKRPKFRFPGEMTLN